MSDKKDLTCIACPVGCPLQLEHQGDKIVEVTGNNCKRGDKYARQEFTDPRRALSTTVYISGARYKRLPVKVTHEIPKEQVMEAAKEIHKSRVKAPIKLGDVILENLLGHEGINVVATRSMSAI